MSERNALRLSPFYPQASFPKLRGCVKEPTGVESQRRIMSAEEQAGFSHYHDGWSTSQRLTGKARFHDSSGQEWEVDFDNGYSVPADDSTPNWRRALRGGGE